MPEPITFVCWKWKQPGYATSYLSQHVNVWASMVRKNCDREHRLICITDDPEGVTECETYPMWDDCNGLQNPNGSRLPSCYRRLKIFDGKTTDDMNIERNSFVFSMDLDIVICSPLKTLLDHEQPPFIGWRGVGSFRPVVYNGSLFKFRAGAFEYLWKDFDPAVSPRETKDAKYFGSDQAWLSYKFDGKMPGWTQRDGVYSYSFDIKGKGFFPINAIIVAFNGKHKPWESHVLAINPWIRKLWRQ